ncbi:MAG: dihydrolipoyl dehydrogenase [Pirellulales bacterium]|nr:dihydrolipoyl dehydrogenase [Pirellulales bacterium]
MGMVQHDLIVIGGGPGGYIAAIRAAQLGLNAACIEKETTLGGTCLRIGCIPSKALLESSERFAEAKEKLIEHGVKVAGVELDLAAMLRRKERIVETLCKGIEGLFRKHKITHYAGRGRITGPGQVSVAAADGAVQQLAGRHIIIATGSMPASLPGIELDGDRVGTSSEALSYREVPPRLVVVGGGYIGMELGSVWNRLGSKVVVLEFLNRILPGSDSELATEALGLFKKQGIEFRLGMRVTSAAFDRQRGMCFVQCADAEPIECDRVLVAVGRTPVTQDLGLETVGIKLDGKGRIPVNDHFQTAAQHVYAIGDCIPGPMLAHKAEEDGVACVEGIVTGYSHVNYDLVPAVVFTHPEIAAVGKTEDQLLSDGTPFRKGVFPFRANGRARTLADVDGKVKILAHQATDRVLGVHILGPRAGDLIAEAAAAMAFGATSEDIARTCHAHPTLSEAIKEAALAVEGRTLSL